MTLKALLGLCFLFVMLQHAAGAPKFQRVYVPEQRPEVWPIDGDAYVPVPANTLVELIDADKRRSLTTEGRLESVRAYGRLDSQSELLTGSVNLELTGGDAGPWFLLWNRKTNQASIPAKKQSDNLSPPSVKPIWDELGWTPAKSEDSPKQPLWGLWGSSNLAASDEGLESSSPRAGLRYSQAGVFTLSYRLRAETLSESSRRFDLDLPQCLKRQWVIDLPVSKTLRLSDGIAIKQQLEASLVENDNDLPLLEAGYRRWIVKPRPGTPMRIVVETTSIVETEPTTFLASESSFVSIDGLQASITTNLQLIPYEDFSQRFAFELPDECELVAVEVNGTPVGVDRVEGRRSVISLPPRTMTRDYRLKVVYWSPINDLRMWRIPRPTWHAATWTEGDLAITIDRPLRLIDLPRMQGAQLIANSRTSLRHRQLFRLSANECEIDLSMTDLEEPHRIKVDRRISWSESELRSTIALKTEDVDQSPFVDGWELPIVPGWRVLDVRSSDSSQALNWRIETTDRTSKSNASLIVDTPGISSQRPTSSLVVEAVRILAEKQIRASELATFAFERGKVTEETVQLTADESWQLDLIAHERSIKASAVLNRAAEIPTLPPLFRSNSSESSQNVGQYIDINASEEPNSDTASESLSAKTGSRSSLALNLSELQSTYDLTELEVRRRVRISQPQVKCDVFVAPPADRKLSTTTAYWALFKLAVPTDTQHISIGFSNPLKGEIAWSDQKSAEPLKAVIKPVVQPLVRGQANQVASSSPRSQMWEVELPRREDREVIIKVEGYLATNDAMPVPLPYVHGIKQRSDDPVSSDSETVVEQSASVSIKPWPAAFWYPTPEVLTPATDASTVSTLESTLRYEYRPEELKQALSRSASSTDSKLVPGLVLHRRPAGSALCPTARLLGVDTYCLPSGEVRHHAEFELMNHGEPWLTVPLPPQSRRVSLRSPLNDSQAMQVEMSGDDARISLRQFKTSQSSKKFTLRYSTNETTGNPLADGFVVKLPLVETSLSTMPWTWRVFTPQEFCDVRVRARQRQTPRLWRHRLFGSLADGNPNTAFNPVDRESWLRAAARWSEWLNLSPASSSPKNGVPKTLQGWRVTQRTVASGMPAPMQLTSLTHRHVLERLMTMLAMGVGVLLLIMRPRWFGWMAAALLLGVLLSTGETWRVIQSLWIGWWLAIPGWFLWEQLGRWSSVAQATFNSTNRSYRSTVSSKKARYTLLLTVSSGVTALCGTASSAEPVAAVEKILIPTAADATVQPTDEETPTPVDTMWYVRDEFLRSLMKNSAIAEVGGDWVLLAAEYEGELVDQAETGLVRPGKFVARYKLKTFRTNTSIHLPLDDEQARWNPIAMLDGVPIPLQEHVRGKSLLVRLPGEYELAIHFEPLTISNLSEARLAVSVPPVIRSKLSLRIPSSLEADSLKIGSESASREPDGRVVVTLGNQLSQLDIAWPSQREAIRAEASYDELQWITISPDEVRVEVQWRFQGDALPAKMKITTPAWLQRLDAVDEPLELKLTPGGDKDSAALNRGEELIATASFRHRRSASVGVLPLSHFSLVGSDVRSRLVGMSVDTSLSWDNQTDQLKEQERDSTTSMNDTIPIQESVDRDQFLDRWNEVASQAKEAAPDQAIVLNDSERRQTLLIKPRMATSEILEELALVVSARQVEAELSIILTRSGQVSLVQPLEIDPELEIQEVLLTNAKGSEPVTWTRPSKNRLVAILDEQPKLASRLVVRGVVQRQLVRGLDNQPISSVLSKPRFVQSALIEAPCRLSVYRSEEVLVDFLDGERKTPATRLDSRKNAYPVGAVVVADDTTIKLGVSANQPSLSVESLAAFREVGDQVAIDIHLNIKVVAGRVGSLVINAPQLRGFPLKLLNTPQAQLQLLDPSVGNWEVNLGKTDRSASDPPIDLHLSTSIPQVRLEKSPLMFPISRLENALPGTHLLATAMPLFDTQRWRVEQGESVSIGDLIEDSNAKSIAAHNSEQLARLTETGNWRAFRCLAETPTQVSLAVDSAKEDLPRLLLDDTRVTVGGEGRIATLCLFGIEANNTSHCLLELDPAQELRLAYVEGRRAVIVRQSPTVWKCELASVDGPQMLAFVVSAAERKPNGIITPALLSEKGKPLFPEQSLLSVHSSKHWKAVPSDDFYAMTQGEYDLERLGKLVEIAKSDALKMPTNDNPNGQPAIANLWQERLLAASRQALQKWELAEVRRMLEPVGETTLRNLKSIESQSNLGVSANSSLESRLTEKSFPGQPAYYASAGTANKALKLESLRPALPGGLESLLALSLAGLIAAASAFITWEKPGEWFGPFRGLVLLLVAIAWWLFMEPSGVGLLIAVLVLVAQARELIAKASARYNTITM